MTLSTLVLLLAIVSAGTAAVYEHVLRPAIIAVAYREVTPRFQIARQEPIWLLSGVPANR